jgi:alcohol dehydrogenase, propanol-preferring
MERTMKAAVVHGFGKPLAIEEADVPRPGADEVLVKIEACGVCHTDLHAAEGDWPVKPRLPFGYSVNGSFAQYALADANYVGRLPSNIGFVEAAPVLCAGVTVYKGLKVADTKPGNWVVISGIGGLGQ